MQTVESKEIKFQGIYDLRYHLLRCGDLELKGRFWHVNTIWEGYNSDGYPEKPYNHRMAQYCEAHGPEDIREILKKCEQENNPYKIFYIMAKFNYDIIQAMPEYKK